LATFVTFWTGDVDDGGFAGGTLDTFLAGEAFIAGNGSSGQADIAALTFLPFEAFWAGDGLAVDALGTSLAWGAYAALGTWDL